MMDSLFSTMPSRCSVLRAAVLCLLLLPLWACPDSEEKDRPETPPSFAREIITSAAELERLETRRKSALDLSLLANTSAEKALKVMERRIQGDRNAIRLLTEYHQKAREQGLSDEEQLERNGHRLKQLKERVQKTRDSLDVLENWIKRDGTLLLEVWNRILQANQASGILMKAGLSDAQALTALRDYSSRLSDARRYWTDELVNAMNGAEVDQRMVDLACGTFRNARSDLSAVTSRMIGAHMDHTLLLRGAQALDDRLEWCQKTLERAPGDDPWRSKATAALGDLRRSAASWRLRVEKAAQQVFQRDPEHRKERRELMDEGTKLLDRANRIFIIEAQKRGWPLPGAQ